MKGLDTPEEPQYLMADELYMAYSAHKELPRARVKVLWDNVVTWELRKEMKERAGKGVEVERAGAIPGSAF